MVLVEQDKAEVKSRGRRPRQRGWRRFYWWNKKQQQHQHQQHQHQQHQHQQPVPPVLVLAARVISIVFLVIMLGHLALWSYRHSQCFSREVGVTWREGPSHDIVRPCPSVKYPTLLEEQQQQQGGRLDPKRICITTLTEQASSSSISSIISWLYRFLFMCRNFDRVNELTWPNRQAYAAKHGYTLVDSSSLVDPSRPPAWSKIKAVQSLATSGNCEWIFWMDADTVIVNSSIPIESFLPATSQSEIDLLVTYDRRFTANSGAWFLRASSPWSHTFLREWWNMKRWVRERGLSLSGDNEAFGNWIQKHQRKNNEKNKIQMVPRCTFNSFGVYRRLDRNGQIEVDNNTLDKKSPVIGSPHFYHKGDFVGHASGIDQKEAGVSMFLNRAQ